MGVTQGSESEIQLAVEKVKAVLSVIKSKRSLYRTYRGLARGR